MKAKILLAAASVLTLLMPAFGSVIFQTGFDSSEGWQNGYLTNTPGNPATGTWYSTASGTDQTRVETEDYTHFTPHSGDGLMFSSRLTQYPTQWYGKVSINTGSGHLWEVTAWQITSSNSGAFASIVVANTAVQNTPGTSSWMAAVAVTMNLTNVNVAHWPHKWVYPLTNAIPLDSGQPVWARFRLLLDTSNNVYSAYVMPEGGAESEIISNQAFTHTLGTNAPLQVYFGLGAPNTAAAWDDITVWRGIPEPATLLMGAVLGLGLWLVRRGRAR